MGTHFASTASQMCLPHLAASSVALKPPFALQNKHKCIWRREATSIGRAARAFIPIYFPILGRPKGCFLSRAATRRWKQWGCAQSIRITNLVPSSLLGLLLAGVRFVSIKGAPSGLLFNSPPLFIIIIIPGQCAEHEYAIINFFKGGVAYWGFPTLLKDAACGCSRHSLEVLLCFGDLGVYSAPINVFPTPRGGGLCR